VLLERERQLPSLGVELTEEIGERAQGERAQGVLEMR
jgi:hypothetical protein